MIPFNMHKDEYVLTKNQIFLFQISTKPSETYNVLKFCFKEMFLKNFESYNIKKCDRDY